MYVGKMDMKITTHWKIASRFTAPTLRCRCLSVYVCMCVCIHTYAYITFFFTVPKCNADLCANIKVRRVANKNAAQIVGIFFFPFFFLLLCVCLCILRSLTRSLCLSLLRIDSVFCFVRVCVCVSLLLLLTSSAFQF